ncbi:MAG: alpha/beta fold hydrolase, partial [Rhizomicrobium sp.]
TTDKRGTGSSSGTSTANFDLRAQDTVAAVGEVRRLMPGVARIGLFGVSQGGWVAPLAATKTAVSFVIVGYGLAEGITAQDRDVVADEVKAAGYGDRELQEARMLSDATAGILTSHAQSGWARFALLEKRFGGEAWLKAIRTNSETGVLLSQPLAQIEQTWRSGADDTMFGYNPIPAIYAVSAPQLWVLAGEDHTAPSARTAAIIGNIEAAKPDIDLVVIRHADHGMIATPRAGDTSTRIAPAFFDVVRDWITAKHLPAPTDEIFVKSGRPG